jgi:hypothetical protein
LLLMGMAVGVYADSKPLSFAPSVSVSLGPSGCAQDTTCSEGPVDSTAADFNNDGKLDIATANNGSDDVTILYGDGHGGLTSGLTLTANGGPVGIASGLLNKDQFPDIVISEEQANKIGVFLSTGASTFAPEVEYDMGISPEGVVLADFNNDSKLDVATADLFSETVSVRLGNGDGTFGDLKQVSVTGGPNQLAVGKLDAGDTLDLAVTLYDISALGTLTGNGDGTFIYAGTASAAITDDSPRGVVLADFNHDGKLDAAVATESFDTVDILLGNGDGTFQTAVPYGVGGFPESVVVGDFNGDNIIDVASADSFGNDEFDGTVSVLVGNGNGTFADSVQFGVDSGAYGLTAADLNGDRLPDLVSDNIDGTTVSVLLNTGTPPTPSCVGDCSGDGTVSINELILGVNMALGSIPVSACPAFDENGSGMIVINELVAAVNNALNGCPSA